MSGSDSGKTYFITGSNRGFGHELVKQLLEANAYNKVIATLRKDIVESYVNQLFVTKDPRLTILKLDFEDPESFKSLQNELKTLNIDGIDVFISTASLNTAKHDVLSTSSEEYLKYFKVNTLGPIETLKILKPHLLKKQTRKIIFTTSILGSISEYPYFLTKSYPAAAYCLSKAGLNLLGKALSYELKDEGFIVIDYTPGLINSSTDQSRSDEGVTKELHKHLKDIPYAGIKNILSLEDNVKNEIKLIENITIEDSGKFLSNDGSEIKY